MSGGWKEGKTHMALGAEPVIYYQSLDMGTEGVIEKFDPSTIRLAQYALTMMPGEGTAQQILDSAYPVWNKFKEDYYQALETAECKTIVWDTESEVWELIRLANFGELNPRTGKDRGNVWGPINAEMLGLIRMAFGTTKSLILLEKTKDEYVNDKKTGKRQPKGFADTPFIAQVVMKAFRTMNLATRTDEFKVEIVDCRDNPELNGTQWPNDWNLILEVIRG